jgi:glycine/D-amino acid oxidase-like deaminating enzyme
MRINRLADSDCPSFCQFLHDQCEMLGVTFLFKSKALLVQADESQTRLKYIKISTPNDSKPNELPCKNLVIAAGLWSDRVFAGLFPRAQCHIPLLKRQPAQSWMRIRTPHWKPKDDESACDQVFLDLVVQNMTFHISSSLGGDMYVTNEFAPAGELPSLPEDGEAEPDASTKLRTKQPIILALYQEINSVFCKLVELIWPR